MHGFDLLAERGGRVKGCNDMLQSHGGPLMFRWLRRRVREESTPPPAPVAAPPTPDVAELLARMDALEGRWRVFKVDAENLLEAIVDQGELVEHKRRQITSAAARAAGGKKGDQAPQDAPEQLELERPMTKDQVVALLRAQGKLH